MVELRNALADYTAYVLPSRVSVIADPGVLSKIPLVQWVQDTKTHLAHFGCAIVHVKRTDGSFFNLWFHSIDYIE